MKRRYSMSGPVLLIGAVWAMLTPGRAMGSGGPQGALVDPPISPSDRVTARRRAVLARVARDRNALVNVTSDLVPSTPELTWLGKKGLPALEWGLTNNTNAEVKRRIAAVVWAFADPHSVDSLLPAARDWDVMVRRYVVQALGAIGSLRAEKRLLELIRDPDEKTFVKESAVEALGRIGSVRAVPLLKKILADQQTPYRIRWSALKAMWDMRFVVSRSQLRWALARALDKKASSSLSVFAAGCAALLHDKGLVRNLEARLRGGSLSVQNAAAYALGEIGDRRAIVALRRRLPTVRSTRLLNNILFALAKLGDPGRIGLIESLLRHRQATIRLNAAFVAGDLKDRRLVGALLAAARDPSKAVQASAVQALAKTADPRSRSVLDAARKRGPAEIALMSLGALIKMDGKYYGRILATRYLRDHRAWVRCKAAEILARTGDRRALPTLFRCADRNGTRWLSRRLRKYPAWTWTGFVVASAARFVLDGGSPGPLMGMLSGLALSPGHRQVFRALVPVAWDNQPVRGSLVRLLGAVRDRKSSGLLWRVATTRHLPTRYRAWYALANLGYHQGWDRLLVALTQAAPSVKRTLASLLASLSDSAARRAVHKGLLSVLSGHGVFTRLAAARALLAFEPGKALPLLVEGLNDRRQAVRAEAAYYLNRTSMRRYLPELRKALSAQRKAVGKAALRRVVSQLDPHVFVPSFIRRLPY